MGKHTINYFLLLIALIFCMFLNINFLPSYLVIVLNINHYLTRNAHQLYCEHSGAELIIWMHINGDDACLDVMYY